jgi:hypothetical protein
MKARSKEFLDRAIAAMAAAIEVYNKPDFAYRGESFTILAANAWELLLKAEWLAVHKNRIGSLYVRQGGGPKRKRIKKTRAGNAMTYSLGYLIAKLREEGKLEENACRNLEILEELRDSAVHFYHTNPELVERIQEIAMAAVRNFNAACQDWFGEDLSRFNFCLIPLSFGNPAAQADAVVASGAESRFLKFVARQEAQDGGADSTYAVAMNVELRFVRSKEKSALPVRVTDDPSAPAVRLTEEQVREKYPWDYDTLARRCAERYEGFSTDRKFHTVKKGCWANSRYAHLRLLDPGNPKGSSKRFYNPAILEEFDKRYKKKARGGPQRLA